VCGSALDCTDVDARRLAVNEGTSEHGIDRSLLVLPGHLQVLTHVVAASLLVALLVKNEDARTKGGFDPLDVAA
jgi:hypothetical protein